MAGAIEQSTDLELLNKKLPLIDQTLGQLLNSPPEPLVLAAAEVVGLISRPVTSSDRTAAVSIAGNLLSRGIEVGNMVEYQNATGTTIKRSITRIVGDTFEFEFAPTQFQAPASTTSFKIVREGGLAARIRSLVSSVDFSIPTLQQMILKLEHATGLNLHDHVKLVGTPGSNDFALQFPLSLDPDPLRFVRQVSFKDKLPKLDFEADAQLELIVDPRFDVTLGISLAKTKPDGSPLSIVERVYVVATKDDAPPPAGGAQPTGQPIAQLDLTARLNDPQLRGRFGFLNVALMEDRPANGPVDDPNTPQDEDGNQGVAFSLHTTLDFQDPDSGVADQRIRLVELATNISGVAKFGVLGALDIDGLKIVASVGNGFELGNVRLSLDGTTNGLIDGFDDFARILSDPLTGIRIAGDLTVLDSFTNITSEQVFAALDLLIEKLRDLGVGSALDKPIPLINRSVAELVDLGESFSKTIGKPASPNAVSNALAMEAYINSKLATANQPDVVDVTLTTTGIEFTFKFNDHVTKILPLAFSAGQSGLSISGDGNLSVNACVGMNLTLGLSNQPGLALANRLYVNTVNPTDASNPPELLIKLLANTGYNITSDCGGATINGQGAVDFSATVGPLGLEIEDARALIDLNIGVDLTTTNANKQVTVGTLLSASSLQPTFTGSVQAIVPIDGNNDGIVAVTGQPNPADARIEVAGRIVGLGNTSFSFAADPSAANDLPHHANPAVPLSATELATLPAGTIKIVSHNLEGLVSNSFLNFGTLVEGLEQLIKWAEKIFDRNLLDRKVPFINKSVGDTLDFLENDYGSAKSLRSLITGVIAKRIGTDGGDSLGRNLSSAAVQKAIDTISDALFSVGAEPLSDRNSDGVLNARDLAAVDTNAAGISGVTYRLKFQPSFSYRVPFDLGLDFLDLQAAGQVDVSGQLKLNLNFGINKDEGFFLLLDPTQPEFGATASISAALDTSARFGFLDVMASLKPGTNMSASFSVDVASPNVQNKVRFADLIQPNSISTLIPDGNLKLDLEAHVIASLSTSINPELPSVSAAFTLDWGILDASQSDRYRPFNILAQSIAPTIVLSNIQLDMGSFFSSVVKSIFQRISDSNLVPEKLLNALSQSIPLLDRTVLELLQEVIENDPNPDRRATFQLLFSIASLITEANSLGNDASDRSLIMRFPDITIGENANAPGQAQPTAMGADDQAQISVDGRAPERQPPDKKDAQGMEIPGSGLPVVGQFIEKLGGMGITFPVLQLSNLMQMLVGNDLDLVFIKAPELDLKKDFNLSFPLIGGGIGSIAELAINAFVGGGFELKARITGGLDTSGLRNGRFLGGFYLGDFDPGENGQLDPSDEERPELQFTGFVQAGIEGSASIIGFDIGRITGYFRLDASINVDLNDDNEINGSAPPCDLRSYEERHDGKLHLNEMRTIADSHDGKFLANFELTGEIAAELGVHILVLNGLILDRTESTRFVLLSFHGTTVPVKCLTGGGGSGQGGSCQNPFDLKVDFDLDTGTYEVEIPPDDSQVFHDLDDLLVSTEDLNGNPTDGRETSSYLDNEIIFADLGNVIDISARDTNIDFTQEGVSVGNGATFNLGGQIVQGVITSVSSGSLQVTRLNLGKTISPRSLRGDGEASVGLFINDGQETLVFEGVGSVQRIGPDQCGINQVPDAGTTVSGISTSDPDRGLGDRDNNFTASGSVRTPIKISGGRGNDRLQGGVGPVEFRGGDGNDVLSAGSGRVGHGRSPAPAKLFGENGRDVLSGGSGDDLLVGGDGDDELRDGPSGRGQALRPSGNDKVIGGGGKDRLLSAGGLDVLVGDYDEVDDRRPTSTQHQHEAADVIHGGTGGKALIFGDNHGTAPNQRGPTPATGKGTGDVILARNASDETFAERDDQLTKVISTSKIQIRAESQDVTISPSFIVIGKQRPMAIAAGAVVEITGSSGIINLQGTDEAEIFTIQRSNGRSLFKINRRTTITLLDLVNKISVRTGGGGDNRAKLFFEL